MNYGVKFGSQKGRPFPGVLRGSKYHISTYLAKLHPNPWKNRGVNPIIFAENPLFWAKNRQKTRKSLKMAFRSDYLSSNCLFWKLGFFGFFGKKNQKKFFLQMKIENYGVFIWKNPIIFFRNFGLWGFCKWKPHNFRFSFAKFPKNPIIFEFHLQNLEKTP